MVIKKLSIKLVMIRSDYQLVKEYMKLGNLAYAVPHIIFFWGFINDSTWEDDFNLKMTCMLFCTCSKDHLRLQ